MTEVVHIVLDILADWDNHIYHFDNLDDLCHLKVLLKGFWKNKSFHRFHTSSKEMYSKSPPLPE